jgi:hypothetical protein
MTGSGAIAPVGMYRASYGKGLDWAFNQFALPALLTPSAPAPTGAMSVDTMLNSPDKLGMLANVSRMASLGMNMPQLG